MVLADKSDFNEIGQSISALSERFDMVTEKILPRLSCIEEKVDVFAEVLLPEKISFLEKRMTASQTALEDINTRLMKLENQMSVLRWIGGAAFTVMTIILGAIAGQISN